MTLKQLLEQKAAKLDEIKVIEELAGTEQRSLTDDEAAKVDELLGAAETLDAEVANLQAAEQRTARLAELRGSSQNGTGTARTRTTTRQPGRQPQGQAEQRTADVEGHPDLHRYSLVRALRRVAAKQAVDGLEGEVSKEIEQRTGKAPQGFFVPLFLPMAAAMSGLLGGSRAEQRTALNTTTGAGALVNTTMPTLIDYLKAKLVIYGMGAEVLADLNGTVDLPKETNDGGYSWVAEGSNVSEDSATIGQVVLNPLTVGAYLDLTRRFLAQTSVDAERFARNRLARSIATALDAAAINGDGSNKPTGILQNSSCPTVAIGTNGGALTWAKIVELETTVAAGNGDAGRLAYLTSPHGRGQLKTIERATGTGLFLEHMGSVNDYPVQSTTLVPNNLTKGSGTNLTAVIFGDFSQIKVGLWGGVDMMVDPYANALSGGVRLIALQDCDVEIGQEAALAKIVDATR